MAGNSTAYLNTLTLPEVSDLVIKEFVYIGEMHQPMAEQLFISEDLTSWPHDQKRYFEVDITDYAKRKPQGAAAKKVQSGIGYDKTMTAERHASEIEVSWEMRRYNKYAEFTARVQSLAHFIPQRKELDLSHRFTFANATSYTTMEGDTQDTTVGDGLALLSASHTLAHSTTTYTNLVSGNPIFSQGALELAEEVAAYNILSNYGIPRTMNFNTIVTGRHPQTCRSVRQVLESTADVDAAHEGVLNYYGGAYRHVKLPKLDTTATGANDTTKKKWWFLVAAGQGARGWQAYVGNFEERNMKAPVEDEHTDDWVYGTRGSWGIVVLSARGVIGSLAT